MLSVGYAAERRTGAEFRPSSPAARRPGMIIPDPGPETGGRGARGQAPAAGRRPGSASNGQYRAGSVRIFTRHYG